MTNRIDNLQAIRGFACLLVAATHACSFETRFGLKFLPLRPMGFIGHLALDLLFVTSGFILTYAHFGPVRRPGGFGNYMWRRAWRVFPTYWVALAFAVVSWVLVYGDPLPAPGWGYVWDMAWLRPRSEHPYVLPVTWTMAYEVLFYVAFGLALVVPNWVTLAGAGGWAAVIIGLAVAGVLPENTTLRHVVSPFMLELLAGCLAAWATIRSRVFPVSALVLGSVGTVVGIAVSYIWYPILIALPEYRVIVLGVPALLLVYGGATVERFGWRGPRWLCWFGDRSYSIYLVHWIGQSVLFYLTLWLNMSHSRTWHVVWLAMMVAVGIGSGLLFYELVERPVMSVVRTRRPKIAGGVSQDQVPARTSPTLPVTLPGRQAA